jgi:hypothetical protein
MKTFLLRMMSKKQISKSIDDSYALKIEKFQETHNLIVLENNTLKRKFIVDK